MSKHAEQCLDRKLVKISMINHGGMAVGNMVVISKSWLMDMYVCMLSGCFENLLSYKMYKKSMLVKVQMEIRLTRPNNMLVTPTPDELKGYTHGRNASTPNTFSSCFF